MRHRIFVKELKKHVLGTEILFLKHIYNSSGGTNTYTATCTAKLLLIGALLR
jgi:hypothetical protein